MIESRLQTYLDHWKQLCVHEDMQLLRAAELERLEDLVREIDAMADLFEFEPEARSSWEESRVQYRKIIDDLTGPLDKLRTQNRETREILLAELRSMNYDTSKLKGA